MTGECGIEGETISSVGTFGKALGWVCDATGTGLGYRSLLGPCWLGSRPHHMVTVACFRA